MLSTRTPLFEERAEIDYVPTKRIIDKLGLIYESVKRLEGIEKELNRIVSSIENTSRAESLLNAALPENTTPKIVEACDMIQNDLNNKLSAIERSLKDLSTYF